MSFRVLIIIARYLIHHLDVYHGCKNCNIVHNVSWRWILLQSELANAAPEGIRLN